MTGRREDVVKAKAQELRDEGLEVEAHAMDVTSDESVDEVVRQVQSKFGHLDVLVNNAGIARVTPPSESLSTEYRQLLNTNVIGPMSVTEKFLPLLAQSNKIKRVVFVSSGAGSITNWMTPGSANRAFKVPAYAVSKSALNALCVQYAVAHEDDKSWKFNCCCPGYVATNMNSYQGVKTTEAGAEIICHLATLGGSGPTGTYVNQEGPIPW